MQYQLKIIFLILCFVSCTGCTMIKKDGSLNSTIDPSITSTPKPNIVNKHLVSEIINLDEFTGILMGCNNVCYHSGSVIFEECSFDDDESIKVKFDELLTNNQLIELNHVIYSSDERILLEETDFTKDVYIKSSGGKSILTIEEFSKEPVYYRFENEVFDTLIQVYFASTLKDNVPITIDYDQLDYMMLAGDVDGEIFKLNDEDQSEITNVFELNETREVYPIAVTHIAKGFKFFNEQKDYLLEVYVYSDDAMVSIWKHNSLVQSYKIDAKCYDVITTQYFKHMDN